MAEMVKKVGVSSALNAFSKKSYIAPLITNTGGISKLIVSAKGMEVLKVVLKPKTMHSTVIPVTMNSLLLWYQDIVF